MRRLFMLVPVLFFLTLFVFAQESDKIPPGIAMAFKTGNATELVRYLNPTVELVLLNKEDFYRKPNAEAILKDFFASNPVKDFSIRHQGSKNDAYFAIGSLKTEKATFRVYLLLKKTAEGVLIHQIRIDPDDGRQTT
ncbi:MAG: DUF4783 domain-containing protein [Bacteroidetes bacterium]|nr:DUF4783 domain-containing protein [Bacteroidota bacterium]